MKLTPDEVLAYVERMSTPSSPQLEELAEETRRTLDSPQMLSGPVVGRLLEFLVFALGARSVLESGTFSGYSALSMAEGLPPDGHIVTLELDETHATLARRAIAALRKSVPNVPVLIGGAAVADAAHARRLGADVFTGRLADEVVRSVEAIVARKSSS